jgi:hypothetical protein
MTAAHIKWLPKADVPFLCVPERSPISATSLSLLTTGTLNRTDKKSELLNDRRFTANQFILAPSPLRTDILCVTSSLSRGVCPLWLGLALVKCTYRTYSLLLKVLPCAQVLCQYRLWKAVHTNLTYLMLQRQLSHLNDRKLDRRQL